MQRDWEIAERSDDQAKSRRGEMARSLIEMPLLRSLTEHPLVSYNFPGIYLPTRSRFAVNAENRRYPTWFQIPRSFLAEHQEKKPPREGRNFFYATREDDRETHKRWRGNKGYGTSFSAAMWILMCRCLRTRRGKLYPHPFPRTTLILSRWSRAENSLRFS